MKILIVTHASFEKPGSIQSWAEKNGYQTQEVRPYRGENLPDVTPFDLIVVMGGPQSPLDIGNAPYLLDEIAMLKDAIAQKKRIIGICLGAQLIGEALGAKTERSPNREIGCYPLELLDAANEDPIFRHHPKLLNVMHWHSDMPGIVEEAILLARSEGCPRQIYRYGDRIYGFQCHFELTRELVADMAKHCQNDLCAGKYIMTEQELMTVNYDEINSVMDSVLDHLAGLPELVSKKSFSFTK